MFNYGGIRKFIIKICLGSFFLFLSIFAFLSLITHDPNDPAVYSSYSSINVNEIHNIFGMYGSYFSSATFLLLNKISYIAVLFCFYHSLKSILGFAIYNLPLKITSVLVAIILLLFNFALIEYNASLVGNLLLEFVKNFGLKIILILEYYKTVAFIIFLIIYLFLLIYSFEIPLKKIKIIKYTFRFILSLFKKIFFLLNFKIFLKKINNTEKSLLRNQRGEKSEPTLLRKNNNSFYNDREKNEIGLNNTNFAYELPSLNLLKKGITKPSSIKEAEKQNSLVAKKLEKILLEFGVEGRVINYKNGPVVTLFEFIPAPGIKNSKIVNLSNDIARAMSSLTARISSQPGKTSIGIEIPNEKRESVLFGDLIKEIEFDPERKIELALGKDISGQNVFADLKKMPHLLIAGTTGSGKSVGINTMIMSILYAFKPSECKLILIDPKMLELSIYENIPHLLTPVVTNPNKAVFALKWVVREMENRYQIMSSINVKNIDSFNQKIQSTINSGRKLFREVQTGVDKESRKPIIEKKEIPLEIMPLIVVIVDEMADLMMVAGKEVENLIQRLAQMARASGIHLIAATQRPSVDVITGTIKANFPSRISYRVASKFDSRTILNEMGAEQLLGSGDMLFLENGAYLKRLHGGFVSEDEIESVVKHVKKQSQLEPKQDIAVEQPELDSSIGLDFEDSGVDELYSKAVEIVVENQKVSTSYIQRYLQIGYNRAARIVEKMEEDGIVSSSNNAGKRTVLKEK